MNQTRKRGDIIQITSGNLSGAHGVLVRESSVTGSVTLDLIEDKRPYVKGDTVVIGPGDWKWICPANTQYALRLRGISRLNLP